MIFATKNNGKLREIKAIFNDYNINGLADLEIDVDILEDGDTFYDNAYKKAKGIYDLVKTPVISDDSGLCIDILDGFPGVMTHRFLGSNASDDDRNKELIYRMRDYVGAERKAQFISSVVYYDGVNTLVGTGVLSGKIAMQARGDNGFGFDSIFELDDGKTLAEMSLEEKNKCSARYLALLDLKSKLEKVK